MATNYDFVHYECFMEWSIGYYVRVLGYNLLERPGV